MANTSPRHTLSYSRELCGLTVQWAVCDGLKQEEPSHKLPALNITLLIYCLPGQVPVVVDEYGYGVEPGCG